MRLNSLVSAAALGAALGVPVAAVADEGGWARELGVKLTPVAELLAERKAAVEPVNLDGVMATALQEGISVLRARVAAAQAEALVRESEAAFDPVVTASAGYSRSRNFRRDETTTKFKQATTLQDVDGNGTNENVVTFSDGPVAALEFDQARAEGYYHNEMQAHEDDLTDPTRSLSANLGLSQSYSWGASTSAALGITHKETYWINNYDAREAGLATWGGYERPWIASVSVGVSAPLPGTKYFGTEASDSSVALRKARLTRERAELSRVATANDALLATRAAYWNLAYAGRDIEVTVAHRKRLEKLAASAERRLRAGELTAHAATQIQAELANIRDQEALAWNRLESRSHLLRVLLNQEGRGLLLAEPPASIGDHQATSAPLADTLDQARQANPTLAVKAKELESARVASEQARLKLRPEVSASLGASLSQTNQVYGYSTLGNSLARLNKPDSITVTAGIGYSRQLGARSEEAERRAAEAAEAASRLRLEAGRRQVERDVANARADLDGAEVRLKISRTALDLAREALKRAEVMRGQGEIPEYELVLKSRAVLDAYRSWLGAWLARRQAEDRLMAQTGELIAEQGEAGHGA